MKEFIACLTIFAIGVYVGHLQKKTNGSVFCMNYYAFRGEDIDE